MQKELLQEIKQVIKRYNRQFLLALLLLFLSNIFLILVPLILRQAIVELRPPHTDIPPDGIFVSLLKVFHLSQSLLSWTILLLFFTIIGNAFKYWIRLYFIKVSRQIEAEVRAFLFERIQMQSQAFFDRHRIGDLLSRLTNDLTAYRDLLGPGLVYPLFLITLAIPSFFALAYISLKLTLLTLIPLLIVPFVNIIIKKPLYLASLSVQNALGELSTITQEHYSGIRIIKGYGLEGTLLNIFSRKCCQFMILNFRFSCLQGIIGPFFSMLTRITTVFLVMMSAFLIFHAHNELSGADFIAFMWIQAYLFAPLLLFTWLLPVYERGRAAYSRLAEIAFEPIEVVHSHSSLSIPANADIDIKNLTFSYPKTLKPAIANFNLHIKGGSWIGITGPVGSGKSTLFRLLNRDYEIPTGMIFFNHLDIHDYPIEAFRCEIVTVEQLSFLFSKTIGDNINFARQTANQEEIEMVAEFAGLHETILEFPEQYKTIVGERGVTLSGGQKQRVAIARAFLVNRTILLLDDIFSAVDTKTEQHIFNALKENYRDKTVILITHRVSILQQMDQVICMQKGQITESGSPADLAERKGYYSALVSFQTTNLDDNKK